MLTLAAHDPIDHVLPNSFFDSPMLEWNLNFGKESIPGLGWPLSSEFWFTNQLLMTLVAAGLCLFIFPMLARSYVSMGAEPVRPRGRFMNLFESLLLFIREEVARPALKHRTDQFMPFLWTMFFFILFCNLLGMVPLGEIVKVVSGGRIHEGVGGTATGNLAVTGGLALCAFFMIHISGVREAYSGLIAGTYGHHGHDDGHDEGHGGGGSAAVSAGRAAVLAVPLYVWNFAPHVFAPEAGRTGVLILIQRVADFGMWVFLLVLETIGALVKPFALMIRLFANMVAGHIVLAAILALIFAAKTVAMGYTIGVIGSLGALAINGLELLVACLQAYIFVFLTALFLGMAVEPEH